MTGWNSKGREAPHPLASNGKCAEALPSSGRDAWFRIRDGPARCFLSCSENKADKGRGPVDYLVRHSA